MGMPFVFHILVVIGLFLGLGAEARAKPYESTSSDKRFFLFFKPAPTKSDPTAQLAYAHQLIDKNSLKKAAKELNYLLLKWPGCPEAAEAQWLRATTLEKTGKIEDAFDEYQTLVTRYAGEAPYLQALTNQWNIAKTIEARRKGTFWLFRGFTTPEKAVPYYESIVGNAPSWEKSPELLYRVGTIQQEGWKSDEAIKTFNRIVADYPTSPFAEKAAFAKAQCTFDLAAEHPNYEEYTRAAYADITFYLTHFETRNETMRAMKMQSDLHKTMARFAFNRAEFYDRIVKKPEAARAAYETFLREFPISDWTERVKARIAALPSNPVQPSGPNEKS